MRWRWVAGTAALVVAVAVVVSFQSSAQAVAPDTSMLKLFPQDVRAIGFVDVAALRSAPLLQDMVDEAMSKGPRELKEFIEKTGFDPRTDLDRVMAGSVGPRDFLIVVRARYDRIKLETFLTEHGVISENYQGWLMFRPPHEDKMRLSLIDGTVLVGSANLVQGAIERNAAPAPSAADNAQLLSDLRGIDAGNQAWGIGDFASGLLPRDLPGPRAAKQLVSSLSHGTYAMRIDTGVHALARGDFKDAQTARNLADLATGLQAAARMQAGNNRDLQQLIDSVQFQMNGTSMIVTVNVEGDLLKRIHPGTRRADQ